jgi:hypothetical protein
VRSEVLGGVVRKLEHKRRPESTTTAKATQKSQIIDRRVDDRLSKRLSMLTSFLRKLPERL